MNAATSIRVSVKVYIRAVKNNFNIKELKKREKKNKEFNNYF